MCIYMCVYLLIQIYKLPQNSSTCKNISWRILYLHAFFMLYYNKPFEREYNTCP